MSDLWPLALLEQIIEWLRPLFRTAGYPIVFTAAFLERSVFVGLVVPGELILAMGGVFAARGRLSITVVIIGAIVAAGVGESTGFWLGSRYGERLLGRLPARAHRQIPRLREHFERQGGPTVMIGRFTAGAGVFVPFVAGMAGMRYRSFVAWDVPAIAVWGTAIPLVGFFFGRNLETIDRWIGRFGLAGLGILVLFVAVTWWRRRRRSA